MGILIPPPAPASERSTRLKGRGLASPFAAWKNIHREIGGDSWKNVMRFMGISPNLVVFLVVHPTDRKWDSSP